LGKRVKMIVVRGGRYIVEPGNNGEDYLVLKDFNLRIKYTR